MDDTMNIAILSALVFVIWDTSESKDCFTAKEQQLRIGIVNTGSRYTLVNSSIVSRDKGRTRCFCVIVGTNPNELYPFLQTVIGMDNEKYDFLYVNSSNVHVRRVISDLNTTCRFTSLPDCDDICLSSISDKICSINEEITHNCTSVSMEKNHNDHYHVTTMIDSLFKKLGWTFMITFYDLHTVHIFDIFSDFISDSGCRQRAYNVDDLRIWESFGVILDEIYDTFAENQINITIICSLANTQKILNESSLYDFRRGNFRRTSLRDHSSWFLVTKASFLDKDITRFSGMLDSVFILNLEGSRNKENVEGNQMCIDLLENICPVYNILTLMWINETKGNNSRLARRFEVVGNVKLDGTLFLHSELQPNIRFGFNKRHLLVTTIWWPPFTERIQQNGTTIGYYGYCLDLVEELSKALNFTYTMTEAPDGEFGRVLDNGSWSGMIGQLERREVDLMVATTSVRQDREMVMDFTIPFYYDSSTLLMKKPDPNEKKIYTLIRPLRFEVLICIGATVPVIALVFYMIESLTPYYDIHGGRKQQTFQTSFWYMVGALMTQGGTNLPRSQSGRILITSFWLFSVVTIATYSSNLMASLTVPLEKPPFNSLDEMIAQSEYKWGTIGGTFFITWFNTTNVETLQKVWSGIKKFNQTDPEVLNPDPNVHIEKMYKEKYVYFGDKVYMEMRKSNRCELLTADEEIPNNYYGVGLPNNSLYTKRFSDQIIALQEGGILQNFKQKHWPTPIFCPTSITAKARKIELVDIQAVFYVIGIGIGMASVCVVFENLISRTSMNCLLRKHDKMCSENRSVSISEIDFRDIENQIKNQHNHNVYKTSG